MTYSSRNSLIFQNYLIFLPDRNDNLLLGKLKTVSITAPLCLVYFPQFQRHKFCIKVQRNSPCYRKRCDRIPFNLLKTNLCNNSFLGSDLFSLLVYQRPPAAMWWVKRSNVPVNDITSISTRSNRCLMALLTAVSSLSKFDVFYLIRKTSNEFIIRHLIFSKNLGYS